MITEFVIQSGAGSGAWVFGYVTGALIAWMSCYLIYRQL